MKSHSWMFVISTVLITLATQGAVAQDRGQYPNDQNGSEQNRRYEQDRRPHDRFDDRDRQTTRQWYDQHRDYRGFRDSDRLDQNYESRLREGEYLDRDMRRMAHPAPYELTRNYGPPPRGYRYVVIGGHVVLVDRGYRIHDVIHLEINP